MKTTSTRLALALALTSLLASTTALAQQPDSYTYATYHYCDLTKQERADEITEKLDKQFYDAAVADGSITGWGWMAHHTGGKWRRVSFYQASSIDGLLSAQKKLGDQAEAKNKAMSDEMGQVCHAHDDYIWKAVAGKTGARGAAVFSVYYVCDATREKQADEIVKRVFAPAYDKLVAEGKLMTWGWMEHIVGGEYRRLATFTAKDMTTLLAARGGIVAAMQNDPLADALTDICGSHADYMWETKFGNP